MIEEPNKKATTFVDGETFYSFENWIRLKMVYTQWKKSQDMSVS